MTPRPPHVPDVEETGETLLDNARLKARALVAATGEAAIADDTGLEVDGLDGAPGVYSARYAGAAASYADNVSKLLTALAGGSGPPPSRRGRFRTVAVAAWPNGRETVAEGTVEGVIADRAARPCRFRLRPGVRARRGRRTDVRRDGRRGEAPLVASGPGLS